MILEIITQQQIESRRDWVHRISRLSGDFGVDAEKVAVEIREEIKNAGIETLLGHLRLCGVIPEMYAYDSSEEKLYSKYTDIVIHEAFLSMGLKSLVLKERADVADVECVSDEYSFVADAKAFRLSRTAKNQKDFKVQAMDGWKYGKPYAIIICPVYQLPARTSQIYQQAAARSVCIGTYTHLAVFARYANKISQVGSLRLMHELFKTVEAMNPSKNANDYWQVVNRTILDFDTSIREIWQEEKRASVEAIQLSKAEAVGFLAIERERIMGLSKEEAIAEVLQSRKIDKKINAINAIMDNGILGVGANIS